MTASDGEATERKTFHLPAVANEWVQEENEAAAASGLGKEAAALAGHQCLVVGAFALCIRTYTYRGMA
jgi:hypothetical protein